MIHICLRDDQRPRPDDLLLVLHIELGHTNRFGRVDLVLREFLCRSQLENIQPPRDLRSVNLAVVPIRRPVAAEHEHVGINRPAIEIGNFNWMLRVGEVHHRDAALVPGLRLDVAAGNRNERAVVRDAVLAVALGRRQLVVTREAQLVVLQIKDGISAPLVRIIRPAARVKSAAPFIGENHFCAIVRKRGRVPIRIVRIVYRVHSFWICRIFDVQKDSVT